MVLVLFSERLLLCHRHTIRHLMSELAEDAGTARRSVLGLKLHLQTPPHAMLRSDPPYNVLPGFLPPITIANE